MKFNLRLLYLYLFSFVGLLISIFGSISLLDLMLKTYLFRVDEDTYYSEPVPVTRQPQISSEEMINRQQAATRKRRKEQLANSIAMLAVSGPLYLYHWTTIKKEGKG